MSCASRKTSTAIIIPEESPNVCSWDVKPGGHRWVSNLGSNFYVLAPQN